MRQKMLQVDYKKFDVSGVNAEKSETSQQKICHFPPSPHDIFDKSNDKPIVTYNRNFSEIFLENSLDF